MKTTLLATLAVLIEVVFLTTPKVYAVELPENRVAVVIDTSGSFKSKMHDAAASTASLLEQMSTASIKRWEPAKDRIILISMDSLPEIIWSGALQDLKSLDQEYWKSALNAREEYSQCTDVVKAVRIAVKELNHDAGIKTNKYMFIFSDLVHEPPTTSIGQCTPVISANPVPIDIPWEELADISIVSLWVPIDQKFAWTRALEEQGLEDTFKLYALESEVQEIKAPPRPDITPTQEEMQQARDQMKQGLSFLGKGALMLLFSVLALCALTLMFLAACFVWARFIRKPVLAAPARRRVPMRPRQQPGNHGRPGPPRA